MLARPRTPMDPKSHLSVTNRVAIRLLETFLAGPTGGPKLMLFNKKSRYSAKNPDFLAGLGCEMTGPWGPGALWNPMGPDGATLGWPYEALCLNWTQLDSVGPQRAPSGSVRFHGTPYSTIWLQSPLGPDGANPMEPYGSMGLHRSKSSLFYRFFKG